VYPLLVEVRLDCIRQLEVWIKVPEFGHTKIPLDKQALSATLILFMAFIYYVLSDKGHLEDYSDNLVYLLVLVEILLVC
jgi:hypothetical protein